MDYEEKLTELYGILVRTGFSFLPGGNYTLKEINAAVRSRFPNLCDDDPKKK